MKKNISNVIITICFLGILFGFGLSNILLPDAEVSYSERRKLAQAPTYSTEKLLDGELFQDYEKYFLDQFTFRDELRGLKALTRFYVLRQKDNNEIYIAEGHINKLEYPLKEAAIINATNKLNEVYDRYLQDKQVYYSIIPDKGYYLAANNGYLSMDYSRLVEIMKDGVKAMEYIDIFPALSIEDYYKTDIHWNQGRLSGLAGKLLEEMGNEAYKEEDHYIEKTLYPFYGSYYGQAALKHKPDTLVYLTNDMLEKATVYDHIDKTVSNVYRSDRFGTIDSYDFFLSGAKSLITITNEEAATDKELILFRDSFGSSIAPLLLKGYKKITLVDLRYMATERLGEYIDFSGEQDILFLYNTMILNNSYMLK